MRKVTALASFLVVAAGTAAVGATAPTAMQGSDTLFEIYGNQTVDSAGPPAVFGGIIKNCPGATGIVYIGTGSGAGEGQIRKPAATLTQRVSPMSRAMNNSLCTSESGGAVNQQIGDAEGIAFALDGLAISAAGEVGGTLTGAAVCAPPSADTACSNLTPALGSGTGVAYLRDIPVTNQNGVAGVQCVPQTYSYNFGVTPPTSSAAAKSVSVPGCANVDPSAGGNYRVSDWKDVLRILLLGMPMGTAKDIANRDCNSDLRFSLANNYAKFFQTDCSGDNGSGATCSQIKHFFRRDEWSGTTDVFLATLGMDGIDATRTDPPEATAFDDINTYKHDRSFFCNVRRTEDTWAFPDDARFQSAAGRFNPPYARGEATGAPVNVYSTRPFFPEYQDADPIRRTCDGTNNGTGPAPFVGAPDPTLKAEQVCGARGSLGLVLPISMPTGATAALRYPTEMCSKGKFELKVGPVKNDGKCDFCPNGDRCIGGNLCFFPETQGGSTACLNGQNNMPVILDATHNVAALPGSAGFIADGRVYNLYLHNGTSVSDDSLKVNRTGERQSSGGQTVQHVGAYYRIHQSRTLNANPATSSCGTQEDDTQQIACLVQASKCSLGFQGREGPVLQDGAFALNVNNIQPSTQCVQEVLNNLSAGDFGNPTRNYPMSRKLFLNTVVGFEDVDGTTNAKLDPTEQELARCTAAIPDGRISAFGFIPFPDNQANPVLRNPFCQDYPEKSLCGAAVAADNNACLNNPSGIPSNGRICSQAAGTVGTAPCVGTEICADLNADGIGDVCQ